MTNEIPNSLLFLNYRFRKSKFGTIFISQHLKKLSFTGFVPHFCADANFRRTLYNIRNKVKWQPSDCNVIATCPLRGVVNKARFITQEWSEIRVYFLVGLKNPELNVSPSNLSAQHARRTRSSRATCYPRHRVMLYRAPWEVECSSAYL